MEITSVNNDLIKDTAKLQQKKYRNISKKFLLEGYKTIKEAYDYGIELKHIFVRKGSKNYDFAKNIVIETTDAILKKLSTTETAPEAIAVGLQKEYGITSLQKAQKLILLENIKDVGNLGTIIRSAAAFKADGIILFGDSADIYNPKCVRSAVGNLWKLPIVNIKSYEILKNNFDNFERIATLPKATQLLKNYTPKFPLLVMFGSEADGLSEELTNYSTNSLKIEMADNVESLNLAISASVIMYELFK